jgi:hypothetical protein
MVEDPVALLTVTEFMVFHVAKNIVHNPFDL